MLEYRNSGLIVLVLETGMFNWYLATDSLYGSRHLAERWENEAYTVNRNSGFCQVITQGLQAGRSGNFLYSLDNKLCLFEQKVHIVILSALTL